MTKTNKFVPKFSNKDLRRVVQAGKIARADRLHAKSVRYDRDHDVISLVLENDVMLSWPRGTIIEFASVPVDVMENIQLSPRGSGIYLEDADIDIDVGGLVADLLPTKEMASALARHGRQTTTPTQSEQARINGAKGGRPRKAAGATSKADEHA